QFRIGEAARWVDGERQRLDVAPILVPVKDGDRTLTPPRHSHEPMGDEVTWDHPTVTVTRTYLPGMEV
ncbi:MAG: hypothetical protein ACOY93_08395, partial [Bacillota bacterium]